MTHRLGSSRAGVLAVSIVAAVALPLAVGRVVAVEAVAPQPAPVVLECSRSGCPPQGRHAPDSRSADRPNRSTANRANSNQKAPGPRVTTSAAKPKKPKPLPRPAGVATSCSMTHAFPARASAATIRRQIAKTWKVDLSGSSWSKANNREVLKSLWQTLDAIDCTPFLTTARSKNDGHLVLSGDKAGSWAWGDYGLTKPDVVSLDLGKLADAIGDGQGARVTRVFVHEIAHAWSVDRSHGGYFARFEKLAGTRGGITEYGSQSSSENFAEAAGYYVARCAWEQNDNGLSEDNPYDTAAHARYYRFVQKTLFGGRTFGPPAGASC